MERLTLASISTYLTNDVIDKVFKLKTNSDDIVKTLEVTPAAPAGEGLISAVYRIKANGNRHTTSFIAKGLVQDSLLRRSLPCTSFFKREALFFSKILPVFIQIQKATGAKARIQSYLPVCYECYVDGYNDYILMEDLSEKNFVSLSANPTEYERDMSLKVLAHFHSVSMALRIKQPDIFKQITNELNEVYYNDENRDWFAKYLQRAITIDKDVLEEVEGTNGIYYNKFVEVVTKEDVYGHLIALVSARGDNCTLNHGDAWCPNFLCSKEQAVTIDFQLVRCTSPATDLSYFIIMCSNLCHNRIDFLEAVNVYYQAVKYYLTDMGFDADEVFPLKTLQKELQECGKFGLFAALTSIPLMASKRCDVLQSFGTKYSGYDVIPLEELWPLTPITSEEYKSRIVNAIRVAVDVGLI